MNYNKVTKEIKLNYHGWLSYSNITESDLLKYRTLRPFKVIKTVLMGGAFSVSMVIDGMAGCKAIGEPLISPSAKQNEKFIIDLSLLLLYIAERLDEANRAAPPIGFKEVDQDYFFQCVKEFLKQENIDFNDSKNKV